MRYLKRLAVWTWDVWLARPKVDYIAMLTVLAAHLAAVRWLDAPELLGGVPMDKRPGLYGACAVVVSLTGTLASVSVAQYLNGKGDRMRALKARFPGELARTWRSVFFGSVLVVTSLLIAYGIDSRTDGPQTGTWILEGAAIVALLRFARLSMLFGDLVELIVLDETEPAVDKITPGQINKDFFAAGPATHGRRSA